MFTGTEIGPATEHHSGGILVGCMFTGTEIGPATEHHSGGIGCICGNCIKKNVFRNGNWASD